MIPSEERRNVGRLIAAARCELKEAEASLARAEDCSAALTRSASRRDEAIVALMDAGEAEFANISPDTQ